MTHQEFDKRLEAALVRYATGGVEDLLPAGIPAETIEEAKKQSLYRDKYFIEAKQAIRELFVDVVGGDDIVEFGDPLLAPTHASQDACSRDKLRKKLRTTITGKEGGDE